MTRTVTHCRVRSTIAECQTRVRTSIRPATIVMTAPDPRLASAPMVEDFESAGLDEERETGAVSWQVYADYVRATGSWAWVVISALLLIMTQIVHIANSLFLGWWSGDEFGLDQELYMVVYAGKQGTFIHLLVG